ncbi:MAG: MFS transporter [Gammaproteobacteria bacterium]|nr:MFS transporter [Gammaproteobacteria bacterium]
MLGTAFGASPLPYNTIGFFIEPLQREFGWTKAEVSFGVTVYGVLGALLAPLFGWLADRYGVRRVALGSLTAFGLVFASFALIPGTLAWYYGLWTLIGLVGIGSTPITWSRAINLWFFRHRGLALGLTLVGTSISAMLLPTLTVQFVTHFGWRESFALLALLPLAVALPVGLAWFREPRAEERPAELVTAAGGGLVLAGRTLGEALREYRFYALWVSIVLISVAYGGALVHMPSMLGAQGFTPAQAASVMGVFGLSIFAGRIITGLLLDRFWAPLVTLPILCLPAVSCYLLATDHALTPSMAVLAAFLLGFSSGAETDLIAYLAGRYFGMANYGQIYGMLYMAFGMSTAVSATLYGWVRDSTGSYDAMLFAAAIMFVVGALLLLTLGRYPSFDSTEVTAK